MNKHAQPVVNSVEVKQSKIVKNTGQRKNPIIHEKINQVSKQKTGSRSRASTSDKLAEVLIVIQNPGLKTVPNTKHGSDNDPTGKDQSV